MLRFDEALARVLALGRPVLPAETVAIDDADGRVVARDVIAPGDLPPFDYSTMDGYAVHAEGMPTSLPVAGESKTGTMPPPLRRGTTMRIFTGAALPEGADAVVMQEEVMRDGDVATFAKPAARGQFVRRRGADLRRGAVAIAAGTRLRPSHLALLAAMDAATVEVSSVPKIAILATGDELRAPGSPAAAGTIPDAISVALRAMARRAGAIASLGPRIPDDREATEGAFASALAESDVLVTIGGVSVGDHDLVKPALVAVGVTIDLWRVRIKPGKPIVVGRAARPGRRDAVVLGLPGNPASAMVTFALFGMPLIRALQGDLAPFPTALRGSIAHPFAHEAGRIEFARATVGGDLRVRAVENQASGAITSMTPANALLVVPEEAASLAAGDPVDVLLLNDLWG